MELTGLGVTTLFKSIAQQSIRTAHRILCDRGLPTKVGLYFHSLEPTEYDSFREMVDFFKERHYRFTSVDTFLADPMERCVYLSFDDNYKAWHTAIPLFTATGITATFFVNTICFRDKATEAEIGAYYDRLAFEGDRTPLSTKELRALDSAGHVIGAHTHSHAQLTALSFEDATSEIIRSRDELQNVLQKPVEHFSYPFGMRRHFSEQLRSWCMSAGFSSVSNAIPCQLHVAHTPDALNRTLWDLNMPIDYNLSNIRIDGQLFGKITGRSAVG